MFSLITLPCIYKHMYIHMYNVAPISYKFITSIFTSFLSIHLLQKLADENINLIPSIQ